MNLRTTVAQAPALPGAVKDRQGRSTPLPTRFMRPKTIWDSLKPVESGPGIVIAEPKVFGNDLELARFGAGCARWLEFTVGGYGEFGKTPSWSQVDNIRERLGRKNLDLTVLDAGAVGPITGATHAAFGTLVPVSGHPGKYSLTYNLFKLNSTDTGPHAFIAAVPGSSARGVTVSLVGTPIELTGSLEQIGSGLPAVANGIAQRLGGKPKERGPLAITPAEFTLLGTGQWIQGDSLSDEQRNALANLAERVPAAGMLWIAYASRRGLRHTWEIESGGGFEAYQDSARTRAIMDLFRARSPENVMAFTVISDLSGEYLAAFPDYFRNVVRRYPNSVRVNLVRAAWLAEQDRTVDSCLALQMAVRCSPQNPRAWTRLGGAYSERAESVRNGRLAYAINEAEWNTLNDYYARWRGADELAVRLDPYNSRAWGFLAMSATFSGDQELAEGAYRTSRFLDSTNSVVLNWGLQMFAPKWGGSIAELRRVAAVASREPHLSYIGFNVAVALRENDLKDEAKKVSEQYLKALQAAVVKYPDDAQARYRLAMAYYSRSEFPASAAELGELCKMRPGSAHALLQKAQWTMSWYPATAADDLLTAEKLDPYNRDVQRLLGYALLYVNRVDEAKEKLTRYLAQYPSDGMAHYYLARVLEAQGDSPGALKEIETFYKSGWNYWDSDIHVLHADLLLRAGRFNDALAAAYQAVQLTPDSADAFAVLGAAAFETKDYEKAQEALNKSISLKPRQFTARYYRGELLLKRDHADEARADWSIAADAPESDRGARFVPQAKERLQEYPLPAPGKPGSINPFTGKPIPEPAPTI